MKLGTGVIGGLKTYIVYQTMVQTLTANQTTYTFNSVPFGDASPRRRIFIGFAVTATNAPDDMSIGGVIASRHVDVTQVSARCQIWSAIVPSGTTGSAVVSVSSGDMDAGAIYVWSAYNLKNNAPHDIASFNTAGSFPADVSVDTLGNGIVVGVARTANINNQTISFTGISNDSQTGTQPFIHTGGHAGFVPAATPRTVTAIRSTGLAPVACALSWR